MGGGEGKGGHPTCPRLWSSRCSRGSGGLSNVPGGRSLPVPTWNSVWKSLCSPFVSRAHSATKPPGSASPLSLRWVLGAHPSSILHPTVTGTGQTQAHTTPTLGNEGHGGAPPECAPPKGTARPDQDLAPLRPEGLDRGVGKGLIVAQGHCLFGLHWALMVRNMETSQENMPGLSRPSGGRRCRGLPCDTWGRAVASVGPPGTPRQHGEVSCQPSSLRPAPPRPPCWRTAPSVLPRCCLLRPS